jgi:hypothetical protein
VPVLKVKVRGREVKRAASARAQGNSEREGSKESTGDWSVDQLPNLTHPSKKKF